jgi:hypothetical protein
MTLFYMEDILGTIIIVTIIFISLKMIFDNKHLIFNAEKFNNQTGFYCSSCNNKTFGQCLRCFNCGYADFDDNTGMCLNGGHNGPFDKNNDNSRINHSLLNSDGTYYDVYKTNISAVFPDLNKVKSYYLWKDNYKFSQKKGKLINRWYHIDPYSYMIQRSDDFECAKPKKNNNNSVFIYKKK